MRYSPKSITKSEDGKTRSLIRHFSLIIRARAEKFGAYAWLVPRACVDTLSYKRRPQEEE